MAIPDALRPTVTEPKADPVTAPRETVARSLAPSAPAVCHALPEAKAFQVEPVSVQARLSW
jgi:hypothetical protein